MMEYHRNIKGKKVRVDRVILHCAAINTGQFSGMSAYEVRAEINRWHVLRGFTQIGYHGLIMPDGEYLACRPFWQFGAHCRGENLSSIGILLVESVKIAKIGKFVDWYTPAQRRTMLAQAKHLRDTLGIHHFSGHNDHANKLCPGFHVSELEL